MAISMTNRLLALVITLAVAITIAIHAQQASGRSLPSVNLGAHISTLTATLAQHRPGIPAALPSKLAASIHANLSATVPGTIQTAAISVTKQARTVIDPESVVTGAYQRDHDALEQLRQRAAALSRPARDAFSHVIDGDQQTLATLERRALDYQSGDAIGATAQMDELVAQAQGALNREQSQGSHGAGSPKGDSGRGQDHSRRDGGAHGSRQGGGDHAATQGD